MWRSRWLRLSIPASAAVNGTSVGGVALLLLSGWNVHLIRHRLLGAFFSPKKAPCKYLAHGEPPSPKSLISIIAVSRRRRLPAILSLPALRCSGFFPPPLYLSHHPFNISVSFPPPSLPLPPLRLSFILRLLQRPDAFAGVLASQIRARQPFLRLRYPCF